MLGKHNETTVAARGAQALGAVGHVQTKDGAAATVSLAACGPACQAVALVGDVLVQLYTLAPGLTVMRTTIPRPPGVHAIVALDAAGPSCLCADGTYWVWSRPDSRWACIDNVLTASE